MTAEQKTRYELALAYQFLAYLQLDDLTYTHLSARPLGADFFFIHPFGKLFCEVTPQNLLKVDLDGRVLEGTEAQYNQTGYVIHTGVYKHRPDVNAIIHLHTPAGVAVSAQICGLLPISQFSFHFYNQLSYHAYDSLALDFEKQGTKLAADLGQNLCMLLKNHGTLTCGTTLQEAFFYTVYLEKACLVQTKTGIDLKNLWVPSPAVCEKARQDMRQFEPDLGQRDWQALERVLKQKKHLPAGF